MKTRQFQRLAGMPRQARDELALEGLTLVASNVSRLADSLELCVQAGAVASAHLTYNAGREEAGKFLALIDLYRAPSANQSTVSRQVRRCGNHLAKLLYAQMADYSIASRDELVGAVDRHRQGLYLDGPMDFDYIFRSDLISEREHALYVDLVDSEGELQWWGPREERGIPPSVPRCMQLVESIVAVGLVSLAGISAIAEAWSGFDPMVDSHCSDWIARNREALAALPSSAKQIDDWPAHMAFVADRWPMPMVELDLDEVSMKVEDMAVRREQLYDDFVRRELGF